MAHLVTDYAEAVVEGGKVAGKYVEWACQRHLDDLQRDDYYFDEQAANRIINFYQLCPHVKGRWSGKPIELEAWQMFIVGSLFGWKRASDDTRKYREAYIQVARKNGKTTLLAPIGLYGLLYDNEPGAEIYSAATTRDQAKEIFAPAKQMVKKSNHIGGEVDVYKNNLSHMESFSKFEPLSSDYDTLEGKNIHMGLVDELHAHPDSGVWDVLADGTGAREEPLMIAITTAGYDQQSFCYKYREDCINILDPKKPDYTDEKQFAYIAELDEEDDWTVPKNWKKANPNLGVSVRMDNLESRLGKAQRMPSQRNRIICKRLNIWVSAQSRWMNMSEWDESAGGDLQDLEEMQEKLEGEKCYAAIDLSSKKDITAYVKLFEYDDGLAILPEFFIPEETIYKRSKEDKVPYDAWARNGYIHATHGNVVDYEYIENQVKEDYDRYNIQRIGADRWQSEYISQRLNKHGIEIEPIGQGFKSMSEPMKEVESFVLQNKLHHFGQPVLRWMAENVVSKTDASDNIKPDKDKSKEKIDGIVALIMAVDLYLRQKGDGKSVYEDRGVRTL